MVGLDGHGGQRACQYLGKVDEYRLFQSDKSLCCREVEDIKEEF